MYIVILYIMHKVFLASANYILSREITVNDPLTINGILVI